MLHYFLIGFFTMTIWLQSGSLSVAMMFLLYYLLMVGILYFSARLILRSSTFYEAMATYNWSWIITFVVLFLIIATLSRSELTIPNHVATFSDLPSQIKMLVMAIMLLPYIAMFFMIYIIIGAPLAKCATITLLNGIIVWLLTVLISQVASTAIWQGIRWWTL